MFGVTSPAPGTAPSGSLFGSTSQPTGTGLFGSTTSQPASTGTGLFGSGTSTASPGGFSFPSSAAQTQPSTGGGLFGSTATSAAAAPSGGFTFGAAQPASTGTSTLFGANTGIAQPTSALFGTSATGTTQPTSTLFGTSTTGTAQPAPSLFGTAASAPATSAPAGTLGGGFSFPSATAATTQPAAPGTGFSFGATTAAAPATSGFSFGATATPASTAIVQPTSTLFGTGAGTTTGTTAGTGFTLPTATATSISQPQTGSAVFGSGTSAPSAPAATGTGFSFGSAAPAPATSTTTAGFSFGTQPTTSQPTSTAPPAFSATATSATPAGGTSTGFGLGGTVASTPSTGFTFGPTTTSTTATTTPTATATIAPLGASATTAAGATPIRLTFGTPATAAATTQAATTQPQTQALPAGFTGLGGIQPPVVTSDPSQVLATGGGTVGGVVRPEERTLQDQPLPVELIELVDALKNHITAEKNGLSELASTMGRSIEKVSETCESIRQQLSSTSTLIHRQILECETLDAQIEKDKKDANMTLMVLNTPPALQPEQKAPYNYLFGILASYQDKIAMYKREILKAEAVLKSSDVAKLFSPPELNLALQSTMDSVILLAAKVKVLHEKVVTEVESHRNLLRYAKGSGSSIATAMLADKGKYTPAPMSSRHTGPPTPFGLGLGADKTIAYLSKANNNLFPSSYPKTPSKAYGDFLDSTIKPPSSAQRIFHSTQMPAQMAAGTSFNSSGFGQSLFQGQSTIFASDLTSPTASGSSLKRSKH